MRYEIETLKRKKFPQFPEKACREMVVNAMIHNDYFEGDTITVEKHENSIIVNNRGELMFSQHLFGRKSEARNRLIADLMARTEYMEKAGTGIGRIKEACRNNNNPVSFTTDGTFWTEIQREAI